MASSILPKNETVGIGAWSLAVMVMATELGAPAAAPVRFTLNISSPSGLLSLVSVTLKVWGVASPAGNVIVPEAGMESLGATAVPLAVAKFTDNAPSVLPVRVTVTTTVPASSAVLSAAASRT